MKSVSKALSVVSRVEVRRHIHSRRTIATVCLLVIVCTLLTFNSIRIEEFNQTYMRTTNNFRLYETGDDFFFIDLARDPLIALFLVCFATLIGANTIAGSRETGTLRVLQTLPYDRRTVFFGLVFARGLVVGLVVATVVAIAFLRARHQGYAPSVRLLVPFTALLVVHFLTFVSIGAALSTLERRRAAIHGLALIAAIGLSVLYVPLSRWASEIAVLAPRQVLYALIAALHDGWHVLSGVSTTAAVAVQLVLLVVPLLYGLYQYERCDLAN